MDLLYFKILIIILIVLIAQAGAYLALKTKQSRQSQLYLSLGNTFAAGIFLGAGLIHMLPDATEEFSTIVQSDFPFAAFIASLGFLLILFIEKVLIGKPENQLLVDTGGTKKTFSSYILLFILSIHSMIAGIALGTENTISLSLIIAIALLAHKGSAAFALVVDMLKHNFKNNVIMKITIFFSCMTPLGIVLGTIIANILSGPMIELTIASFDALAAGTFIYIAIMEILNDEFKDSKHNLIKFILSASGLLLMALLAVWL